MLRRVPAHAAQRSRGIRAKAWGTPGHCRTRGGCPWTVWAPPTPLCTCRVRTTSLLLLPTSTLPLGMMGPCHDVH